MRGGEWGVEREMGKGRTGGVKLGGGDQEGEGTGGREQSLCGSEDVGEALDGAESHDIEGSQGEGFGADVLYIDVRQCKGAGDFAEEGGFLLVGFDQREGDLRSPEFYGDAGEASTGAHVGYAGDGRCSLGVG